MTAPRSPAPLRPVRTPGFLAGGGEMGRLIRAHDWSATPLGAVDGWPQSLRTAVSMMLESRFGMYIAWGPAFVQLYNDGYRPILGITKHPAIGRSTPDTFREIWPLIGPMFEGVMRGEAVGFDDFLLPLDRNGYVEECYFTFSYSPIRTEGGGVGGVLVTVTETTGRILGERRLRTLRDLGGLAMKSDTPGDVLRAAAVVLGQNAADLPFTALYDWDSGARIARLVATSGVPQDGPASPSIIALDTEGAVWPIADVVELRDLAVVVDPPPGLVAGPWPEPLTQAAMVPVAAGPTLHGFLVAGVSPRHALDEPYGDFLMMIASAIGGAMADVAARQGERRRVEALTELDRAKTMFLGNVSHEFRTPLTLLLAPLEDALAVSAGTPLHPPLDIAHRNALRLLKLVNALLDFSRLEAGRIEAVYEPVDLAVYTAELASVFRAAVERAGLALDVDCPPLPEPVVVDREMWEKIVFNLLSNALKFTFEGGITVRLRPDAGHVVLEVRDTGIGIAPEDQARVFERFHRIRDARSRTHEGAGIGLALVEELVRLHGGSVTVESAVDKGSAFRITVPFGVAHLPADRLGTHRRQISTGLSSAAYVEEARRWLIDDVAPDAAGPPAPGPARAARVLVADDNADMRDYLRRVLGQYWTVDAAADGAAALARAREHPPDLIVADVMMPRLDGFGLLHAVRADAALRMIPLILVSARAGEEARVEGIDAGADDYLVKPFSARELVARVNAHLSLAQMRGDAHARETEARHAAERAETGLAQLLERERAARAEAEAANRSKDEFLAVLSHELRTPLNAILGWARILTSAPANPEMLRRALETIDRNAQLQAQLIDDLLDVSRIIAGKLSLEDVAVDLVRVVDDAVASVSSQAESRKVRVARVGGEGMERIAGDPARLQQVVWNLLSNAIKFTPPGGDVIVTLEAVADRVEIAVLDTGKGIDPAFLPYVFERFRQEDSTTTREKGGLGLGLAIVRHIVERHGGTVGAASEGLDRGSTFTVRLPRRRPPSDDEGVVLEGRPRDVLARVPNTMLRGVRVLVVEDDQDSREMIAEALEDFGATVRSASSVDAALHAYAEETPHVVVSDISMPGQDGYELIRRVRLLPSPGGARVSAIALTAYARPEDRLRSLLAGFDMHVSKPVDPVELTLVVARLAGVAPLP